MSLSLTRRQTTAQSWKRNFKPANKCWKSHATTSSTKRCHRLKTCWRTPMWLSSEKQRLQPLERTAISLPNDALQALIVVVTWKTWSLTSRTSWLVATQNSRRSKSARDCCRIRRRLRLTSKARTRVRHYPGTTTPSPPPSCSRRRHLASNNSRTACPQPATRPSKR